MRAGWNYNHSAITYEGGDYTSLYNFSFFRHGEHTTFDDILVTSVGDMQLSNSQGFAGFLFFNDAPGVTITNCTVSVSTSGPGRFVAGYVYYSQGPLTIQNSQLQGSHPGVSRGAGYVYVHRGGDLTISGNTV